MMKPISMALKMMIGLMSGKHEKQNNNMMIVSCSSFWLSFLMLRCI
jgi:hypothetical protein